MATLTTGSATQAMDFQGRTGNSISTIISQDPSETSIGLGKNTGGALGAYNICIGLNAGSVNTGIRNVAVGVNTISVNTPVNDSVSIGYNAGKNVALDSNVLVGSGAGENITFGSLNCGVGYQSLQNSTNGWYNCAYGSNSLENNSQGSQNVALGSGAMQAMMNSNQNTVAGYLACFGNDGVRFAGGGNSVFGAKAAYKMSTSNNVVSIGSFAAYNGTADENVHIGYQSGFSNVSATGLVTVGSKAGYSALSGNSVYIGNGSGTNVVDGYDNTYVGCLSDRQSVRGVGNTYIGSGCGALDGTFNTSIGAYSFLSSSCSDTVAIGYRSGQYSSCSGGLFIGNGAGAYSVASECLFIGNNSGSYCTKPLSMAIGMVMSDRPPLITGNMDTSASGKPGLTCRGNVRIQQNPLLSDSYLDDGLVMFRNDNTVKAAWHQYIDDNGKYIFGKNGKIAAILQHNAGLLDVPSLDFTGQHRCRATPVLMEMVMSGKTLVGLPVQGCIVKSSGKICTAIGKNGETFSDHRGVVVSQALPVVDIASLPNDKAVFGVVAGLEPTTSDNSQRTYNVGSMMALFPKEISDTRVVINSLGEGAIWVCNEGVSHVENGDYLVSSSLPGVAQKQRSPFMRNSTVAKLTAGFDFDPKSSDFDVRKIVFRDKTYACALLPCTFHCG